MVYISRVYTNSSAVLVIRSTPDTCLDRVVCRAEDGAGLWPRMTSGTPMSQVSHTL